MQVSTPIPKPGSRLLTILYSMLAALLAAVFILISGAFALLLGARFYYADRALPGIRSANLDLSGMTRAEIEVSLAQVYTYPSRGRIVLHDGETLWIATPSELGLQMDYRAMADEALSFGWNGRFTDNLANQLDAWYSGYLIAPRAVLDQRLAGQYLNTLAAAIDRPTREASVSVKGLGIEVHPGQIGRRLDIPAALELLTPSITRFFDVDLALPIEESPPAVLDASEIAAIARTILAEPLVITSEFAGPWSIEPQQLAEMLSFELVEVGDRQQYTIRIDQAPLLAVLEPLIDDLAAEPQNARFVFNDTTRQLELLQPAVIGRRLDLETTLAAITEQLLAGEHRVPLRFAIELPPANDNTTGAELGITEEVSVVSTYFSGSSSSRVHNIKTAAAAFHGLLVAPGETVSMAEVLGEISLDTGYAEALIIYGNSTINGVGGGVCQVSTTLFRAAFFGGYQLDERHPHAYRVSYYEQGPGSPGPGLDATVFIPKVDFKFTNDSEHWLLLETYVYNNRQLLWKFYSTSDGRQVTWSNSGPLNVKPAPAALYRENAELAEGQIKQVDWAADGMNINVTRKVTRSGETLHNDVIKTRYIAWQAVYEYGPGTVLPEGVTPSD